MNEEEAWMKNGDEEWYSEGKGEGRYDKGKGERVKERSTKALQWPYLSFTHSIHSILRSTPLSPLSLALSHTHSSLFPLSLHKNRRGNRVGE